MKDQEWTISISALTTRFKGFKPVWYENTYPVLGNKGQAGDMKNISLLDPNVLAPGPKPTDLTNGDEDGAITTLVKAILPIATSSGVSYAVGGNLIQKISNTTVTDDGTFPLTINKAVVTGEDATDLVYYKSVVLVFFNHSGNAGDIAKLTLPSTLDPDWGSTVPSGAATLENAPHYAIVTASDVVYFTNGKYVGKISSLTSIDTQKLDFWDDGEVVGLGFNGNRVIVLLNRPNISGSNFNQSGIYMWDGSNPTWDDDPIDVQGRLGAVYVKNGIEWVWWDDSPGDDSFNVGYIFGDSLKEVTKCKGTLPNQKQVGEFKGHLAWISDGMTYLLGAPSPSLTVELSQYGSVLHTNTQGAFATPFGDIILSSYDGSSQYSLAKLSGFTVDSEFELGAFPMTMAGLKAEIDLIQVETEPLGENAQCDFTLTYDKEQKTLSLDSIAYDASNTTKTLHKILKEQSGLQVEDFRLDLDHSEGSEANPVEIRSILIKGHWVPNL